MARLRVKLKPIIVGVDPGLSGALAFIQQGGSLSVEDMPVVHVVRGAKNKREVDLHGLDSVVKNYKTRDMVAFVERVGAMPGQGVTSMFSFGFSYGAVLQALASNGVVLHHVTPQAWRKSLSVRKGKEGSRMRASELMPSCADLWPAIKHTGRAEAALIAYHGFQEIFGRGPGL